jgi:hypothetical protein
MSAIEKPHEEVARRVYYACRMRMRSIGYFACLIWVLAGPAVAQPPSEESIDGLGKGTAQLSGPWHFHLGDDLRWAQPEIDDTPGQGGWESIAPDQPWGSQGHYAQTGFGWYRLRLRLTPAPDSKSNFEVLLPRFGDACEVYWNGVLVGRYGTMPPHASWPAFSGPIAFPLSGGNEGTLAIRFWMGPLGSSSEGTVGGLYATPIVGDSESIKSWVGTWNLNFLQSTLFANAMNLLYVVLGITGILLWIRRRKETLLFWFSIFAICPAIWTSVYTMRLPVTGQFATFILQPLWQVRNVALWFLLIELLNLRKRRNLVQWARILAAISMLASFLDGCLTYAPPTWISHDASAWIDGFLTLIVEPCDLYLIVLAAFGFRQKLDRVRWVLAVSASLAQLAAVIAATAQQGQRFTHWTFSHYIYMPLFHVGPAYFTVLSTLDLLVFFSILYAVYRYLRDQQTRKAILEQELASARELQEVLIPEKPPTLPGFTVSSAYHPALDVGGDFVQIIPLDGKFAGSTVIVLGDVSGKGLRAAMAVSLIVGAVRTLTETTASPAEILAGLSRRLFGRLQGGFTTCLALRLDPGGACTIASAGHPAPYLNDEEINLPGALPLGIDPETKYEEASIQILPGDRCALYTDGLLEARAPSGEIFSFERLKALFATDADAARASDTAVNFGQEDDITVLTLTRTSGS